MQKEWENHLATKVNEYDDMYSGGLWKVINLLKDGKKTAQRSMATQGFMDEKGDIQYGPEALTVWEEYFKKLGSP